MIGVKPPPNHPVKTLFRVLLWFLPAGFAVMSFFGMQYLGRGFIVWYLIVSACTFGTGWYNALLSNNSKLEGNGILFRAFIFWIVQHLLVPLILVVFLYAACLIYQIKI
jgi:VIT1/CCC1 family predicted Fe2+/Mn2+ transporter